MRRCENFYSSDVSRFYLHFLSLHILHQWFQLSVLCGLLIWSMDIIKKGGLSNPKMWPAGVRRAVKWFMIGCVAAPLNSTQPMTQLNEHVRTQVLTPQCLHLFNTTTYETTHLLLHVLIYLQFRPVRLCNHTRHPGASKTCLNVL